MTPKKNEGIHQASTYTNHGAFLQTEDAAFLNWNIPVVNAIKDTNGKK